MTLAGILEEHWAAYVERAGGLHRVPAGHRRAVEAVLACRTPRMGGSAHLCADCGAIHHVWHSCNHRACPRCGSLEDSGTGIWKTIALEPVELIRRWLLHVLPKGFVRVRHYGFLSPAAHKALRRVRHLLGLGAQPKAETINLPPLCCPRCDGPPRSHRPDPAPARSAPPPRTVAALPTPTTPPTASNSR